MNTIPWCANVYLTLVEVMILHIFYRLRYYELQTKIYITSRNKIGFCQCVNYYDNFLLLCWFSNMIYSYNKGFQHRGAANNLWGRVYCRINRHQDFKTFFLACTLLHILKFFITVSELWDKHILQNVDSFQYDFNLFFKGIMCSCIFGFGKLKGKQKTLL